MKKYRIATGSVTYAIKGRDILRQNGFQVGMERITSGKKTNGCGYTIIVSGDIDQATEILTRYGVKFSEISEY